MLIDGAHALGALHLDLRSLDPDYYVSNAHKWFCAPKGCAFMYVKKELQSQTRPLIISHGFGSGFNSEFIWAGIFIFHLTSFTYISKGRHGHDHMIVDLQLPLQSVPIITNVVSSNLVHGEVYSIQHYVRKFGSDLRQVGGFLRLLQLPPHISTCVTFYFILYNILSGGWFSFNIKYYP